MKHPIRIVTVALALAVSVFAHAAVDSTDLLIKALIEKKILTEDEASAVRAEIATIRQDEEAARKSAPVTGKRTIKLSGYVQARYLNGEGPNTPSTLEARRVRLALAGDASPDVDYKVQVDFAGSRKVVIDNTFKTALASKPTLLDAVVGIRLPGDTKLAIGQFKVPFGLENLTSSTNLDTINRAQVTEALVPGRDLGAQGRDIGVQWSGTRALGATPVEFTLGLFDGAGINTGDDNEHKDLAARLVVKPSIVPGLALGLARYDGETGALGVSHDRTGGELVYLAGPWVLRSEAIWGEDGTTSKAGWYATLVRSVTPRVQAVARLDRLDPNTDVAGNVTQTVTGGLTWLLTKDGSARWQLNYERKREQAVQLPNDQFLGQIQVGF
jgi:phosphate-selective porin